MDRGPAAGGGGGRDQMNFMKKRRGASVVFMWILIGLVVAGAGGCVTRPEKVKAREADEVLARWVEVLGGEKAIRKIAGVRSEVGLRFAPGAPELVFVAKETTGGRFRWELSTPAYWKVTTVSDGRAGYMMNDVLGVGLMEGRSFRVAARDSDPQMPLKLAELFPVRRRLPDVVENGARIRVVELTDTEGVKETWFMDAESGQRVRMERPEVTIRCSDFRKVGDYTVAYAVTNTHGAEFNLKAVSFTERWDDGEFAVSPEMKAGAQKAAGILKRHVEAVGGEALERVRSRVSVAEVDIENLGIKFDMKITQQRPNRVLMEHTVPGMGTMYQGYDGTTGWASSELQGYRELKGQELTQLLTMADLGADTRLQEICPFRELAGERELPGGRATGIKLGSLAGPNGTYWFDHATGRLVRVESAIITGPKSHVTMTLDMSDFREVDGVWMAFTTRVDNPTMKMVTRIKSVENNVAVDEAIFRPRTED